MHEHLVVDCLHEVAVLAARAGVLRMNDDVRARPAPREIGLAAIVEARLPDLFEPPIGDPDLLLLAPRLDRLVTFAPAGKSAPGGFHQQRLAALGIEGIEPAFVEGRAFDLAP